MIMWSAFIGVVWSIYPYSQGFQLNGLTYMGKWPIFDRNKTKQIKYRVHKPCKPLYTKTLWVEFIDRSTKASMDIGYVRFAWNMHR